MARIIVGGVDASTNGFLCRIVARRTPEVSPLVVRDGIQLLELLAEDDFRLAFLDQDLESLSGMEVIRRARCAGLQTPLVLLAHAPTRDLAARAARSGAQDLLEKPVLLARAAGLLRHYAGAVGLAE